MGGVGPSAGRAARLPAGPSNPGCNAGMSFITLRDSASLPPGPAARRLFVERFAQLSEAGAALRAGGDARAVAAAERLAAISAQARGGFDLTRGASYPGPAAGATASRGAPP